MNRPRSASSRDEGEHLCTRGQQLAPTHRVRSHTRPPYTENTDTKRVKRGTKDVVTSCKKGSRSCDESSSHGARLNALPLTHSSPCCEKIWRSTHKLNQSSDGRCNALHCLTSRRIECEGTDPRPQLMPELTPQPASHNRHTNRTQLPPSTFLTRTLATVEAVSGTRSAAAVHFDGSSAGQLVVRKVQRRWWRD